MPTSPAASATGTPAAWSGSTASGWRATRSELRNRVKQRFLDNVRIAGLPAAQLRDEEKELKKRYSRGRRDLEHEFGKSMRYKSIRDLVSGDSGAVIKDLEAGLADEPLERLRHASHGRRLFRRGHFRRSQPDHAGRGGALGLPRRQAIVVGDEMQLPPTDFFSARQTSDEEEELLIEEAGEVIQYDLASNSFLNHAAKNLPSTMLGWHYRSRSESLISFSNWAFYDGRLLTVPEERLAGPGPPADRRSPQPSEAEWGAERAARAVRSASTACSTAFTTSGGTGPRPTTSPSSCAELLRRECGRSIGIVAFSEAQQDEIEGALQRLAQDDAEFRDRLDAEWEREIDGQFVGLLVKNLENIQGDERDIIILSVCYGYGPNGKMLMNFGPINKSGGERRLNVAFSRAKHHMAIVSSIQFADITNDYNDGANCLKNYLRYAEAVSTGNQRRIAPRAARHVPLAGRLRRPGRRG